MNKNYLIIGGSSGIGKELVSILAKEGHNVFATYNENKVENHDKVQYQKFNVLNDFSRFKISMSCGLWFKLA